MYKVNSRIKMNQGVKYCFRQWRMATAQRFLENTPKVKNLFAKKGVKMVDSFIAEK